jgi:DNA repair exonuclease SbcCD nuclease subunit
MIFITGDCHGEYTRLNNTNFPIQENMTKDDFVIVLGDFGFWDNSVDQQWWRAWLNSKNFTTLFIDGNHENYDLLSTYPVDEWHGGKVQKILPSVIHLMRGQIFDIDGSTFFTFGGAKSHDADVILEPGIKNFNRIKHSLIESGTSFRVNHTTWWKEEMPSKEEYEEGMRNLAQRGNNIQYILSHCAPSSVQLQINNKFEIDDLTRYLQKVSDTVDFKQWYFGHYHIAQDYDKYHCLYYEIREVGNKQESDFNCFKDE